MEDCCAVCAEPLEWLAYGSCGHKDACSKCVARLRFVLQDKRCVICQQQSSVVVITRNMGSFTPVFQSADFDNLRTKVEAEELHWLPSAEAFFDDKGHLEEIRELCSYTHPVLASEGNRPKFKSLRELESTIKSSKHLQFCHVCVSGRKVFISEQILYSDADFQRHMRTGDVVGPLAESGFPGHPQCRFCRKRFFGDNEIFTHMQQKHEQCFLCRRGNPNKHVYYRDYRELEEHFQQEHFACGHPTCLENKFVVFATEAELKQHQGKEHGGNMSRAERRQALNVPVHLQFRHDEEARAGPTGQGITIGGPNNSLARFQPRPNDARNLAAATQASLASARSDAAKRDVQGSRDAPAGQQGAGASARLGEDFNLLRDGDFPSAMPGASGAPAAAGRWAGALGGGAAGGLRDEDFPSLPGISKSAKRRAKQKEKDQQQQPTSLAERTRPGEVRVLNRASAQPRGARDGSVSPLRTASSEELLPQHSAGPASQEVQAPSTTTLAARRKAAGHAPTNQPSPARHRPEASPGPPASPQQQALQWRGPAPSPRGGSRADMDKAFPALGGGGQVSNAQWAVRRPPAAPVAPPTAEAQARMREADFPVLGRLPQRASAAPRVSAAQQASSSASPPAQTGGASDAVKAAHRALLDKVRRQLDEEALADFKAQSALFFQGQRDTQNYLEYVVSLGLATLVPEIASLMPDADKRSSLLSAYKAAFATGPSLARGRPQPFVPPEAAAAAADAAACQGIWQCDACTLINVSAAASCAACGHVKPSLPAVVVSPSQQQRAGQQGSPSAVSEAATSQDSAAAVQKPKQKKVPKFDRLRVTGGDGMATQDWLESTGAVPVRPQNVWTHNRSSADHAKQAGAPLGGQKPAPVKNGWATQQVSSTQKAWAKS